MRGMLLILPVGFCAFLLTACSQKPESSQPSRNAIGPSPWAFRDRTAVVKGITYRFKETAPSNGKLFGLISLQNAERETLLILDAHCYIRILDDGMVLLWR
jgi:hypothetical protein